jgi:hypothetical protein
MGTARTRWFDIIYLRRQVEHSISRGLSSDLSQELGTARTLVRYYIPSQAVDIRFSFPGVLSKRPLDNVTAH